MKRVGVLGGGQLGTMLASAVHDLGAEVRIFDPDPAAPACARFRDVVTAPWTDEAALSRFFAECSAVTYEMEHIDTAALRSLVTAPGAPPLLPSLHVLETTQDRAKEKTFLKSAGLPHVDFAVVRGAADLMRTAPAFGFPFVLKTTRGGYDGKGQALVAGPEQLERAAAAIGESEPCVLEEVIDLALEASVIVARSRRGEEVAFPVFENAHEGHVLDVTVVPARVSPAVAQALSRVALEAARALDVHGLLTVEFFVTRSSEQRSQGVLADGYTVFVNELAPRPHNSGHVTRNACTVSQYDALARVLLDVPLGAPELVDRAHHYCMGNLLGDVWLAQRATFDLDLSALRRFPEVIDVVLYGKREALPRRKMGHFVARARDADEAVRAARAFRKALTDG
jgi:5-(carboxyamino)imidazole ribonucleotide synthase